MASKLKIILLLLFLTVSGTIKAQVLISLLFGDKLNTEKIEFGLTGGMNRSYFNGYNGSEGLNNFNLGIYFHIMLKENSFISTGVLVKSNVGATGMPTYPLNDPDFDEVFEDGILTTKVNYFYVPIMYQQRINNRLLLEGGIQSGLRSKAFDYFNLESNGGDLEFRREVSDDFTRLDFGLVGGMGYKLKNKLKSMSVGVLYFYGIVDVKKNTDAMVNNSSLNFYLRIPIGVGSKDPKD
ncbi:PorT family protein [Aquiflexum sp. TKW24L]|uniref:outer membrane beta-barrel protein n=1 Tax=Aquiflexum sp. TKW24L TaxID=2942212 RepID=UPI0020BF5700|nr:outer membrane beta-barrel protein [Aquiflexum sp. TKW24L]MCL6258331.1 PorT family protein [Aquiflexum sp. TKW24L]